MAHKNIRSMDEYERYALSHWVNSQEDTNIRVISETRDYVCFECEGGRLYHKKEPIRR